jgi:acetyl esterase/lipase
MMRLGRITASVVAGTLLVWATTGCGSTGGRRSTTTAPSSSRGVAAPASRSSWGKPLGRTRARALLLLIHGGGWKGDDTPSYESMVAIAPMYERLGYETLTIDYRGGPLSVEDAESFYRLARERVGPRFPICALGPSAGGNIALLLAVRNPDLACVIDLAGPTDLVSLANQPGGTNGYALAVHAFGRAGLAANSPALHASAIRAKVLLVYAENDPIVPLAQGREMAKALPGSRLIVLPPGPISFVHSIGRAGTDSGVSDAAYNAAQAAGVAFLAEATRSAAAQ